MGFMDKLLGNTSEAKLKKLAPLVKRINELEPATHALSDGELRAKTDEFKARLANGEKEDDILCEAYAVVREAAMRTIGQRHFDVQLYGGIVLHRGNIAEMKTGEGKTITETLPAYLNALSGHGVHIVTVNDYLAKRDAAWMGKIFRFLGLSVGCVVHELSNDERRAAYNCDITYGTNNEFGFDYLRDNMVVYREQMVQRELNYAIVDEVDSILIDEARTPLIISGTGEKSTDMYAKADRFVCRLVRGENIEKLSKADIMMGETQQESGDYMCDIKARTVALTQQGQRKAETFFGIDDISDAANTEINHHIIQALKAHALFTRDKDYVVQNGQVLIVDEFTGRLMMGRRYSDGLHQALEAKEHVKVERENKTLATITFQNYFRLYKKLSGMTGTAKTEEEEFRSIYGLDVLEIPTNEPVARIDANDVIYSTVKAKEKAIIEEIKERHAKGQPVLVGTVTVEKSEEISRLLIKEKIKHNVLNAKNHAREAEIVAQAGRYGAVTIATNMAGRGTDILLGGNPEFLAKRKLREEGVEEEDLDLATSYISEVPENIREIRAHYREVYDEFKKVTDAEREKVIEAGGLHILGTERHESRRIDNQLRGRSGRQGDPGSSVFFISLEDDLAKRFGGDKMQRVYEFFKVEEDTPLSAKMLSRQIENAQRNIEGRNFGIRKHVLEYDDVMNKQREVMYAERLRVIKAPDVHEDILNFIPDHVRAVLASVIDNENKPDTWDIDALNKAIEQKLLPADSNFVTRDKVENWDYDYLVQKLTDETIRVYEDKIERYKEQGINYHELEKIVLIKNVDTKWIDHIDSMDQLRKGISLRSYGQVDPVVEYKKEGLEMYEDMTDSIREDTVGVLLKAEIEKVPVMKREEKREYVTNDTEQVKRPAKAGKSVGRNDPCPCGSGKKYKNCCGKNA